MNTTTSEIRASFLKFFESKKHNIISSGSVIPSSDPTLMFVNAGMVPFKNVFVGKQKRPAPRATTVQKCIRISGKHNDLENVGRTSRHHTFFEMLGNFSFGDYFKEEACRFGWEFLTEVLKLDKDKLWISVFKGDETAPKDTEAIEIWTQKMGVSMDRILEGEAKDNFWTMGETGPCGPCSEIMYDRGEAFGEPTLENGERFFEIWNLVFMQYMVENPGDEMLPLPAPSIDTGAGLERIASILQNVDSNYDTDMFVPLINETALVAHKKYGENEEDDVSMRVIADHARMAAHLIAEGVFPEKTGREYVLRRVMRRAIRHGHKLGIEELFFHKVADKVVEGMQDAYPELKDYRDLIKKVCMQEEERFRKTLSNGLDLLQKWQDKNSDKKLKVLPGDVAFDLSATYGFPVDLVEVIGEDAGFSVDFEGYKVAEEAHKLASGAGKIGEAAVSAVYIEVAKLVNPTIFKGYDALECDTNICEIIKDGEIVSAGSQGDTVHLVLDSTSFYGESGGQVGDMGVVAGDGFEIEIKNTTKPVDGIFVHEGLITKGSVKKGTAAKASVDKTRRGAIAAHHTATHLLHGAMRNLLGSHATQKGSRVTPGSLRFDFAHFEPLTSEQISSLERSVNEQIIVNNSVSTTVTSFDEAKNSGAMALFEENYSDEVRLVKIGDYSKELCGGTHADASGNIGSFHIVSEGGIAAGVRRIEAVCGMAGFEWNRNQRDLLNNCSNIAKCSSATLEEKISKMLLKERELNKQIEQMKRDMASGSSDVFDNVKEINGIKVLAAKLTVGDPGTLRDTADKFKQKLGSGVICLAGENKSKASIVVAVTKDLAGSYHAGKLIKDVAAIVGGKGGGRPDFAQAGGSDVSKLDEAVNSVYDLVSNFKKDQ